MVQFRERGLMRLRSKLSPLSAMVVQCGGRQGEPKERRREGLERDIFGDDRKGLKLQPWRFKWQVLSQSTDSITKCNLFCNLGLQIINSLID